MGSIPHLDISLPLLEDLQKEVNKTLKKPQDSEIDIKVSKRDFDILQNYSQDELSEAIGVLRVQFSSCSNQEFQIDLLNSAGVQCERCRRPKADQGKNLCTRCQLVL